MSDAGRSNLAEFVPLVDLESVECVECGARSTSRRKPGEEPPPFATQPSFQLGIRTPDEDDSPGWFSIEIRVDIEFEEGAASVAHRAVYAHKAEELPSMELLTDFTNEVALMLLLPYLREGLAEATRRVFGQPLMMPMLQRGQLQFPVPERVDEPQG